MPIVITLCNFAKSAFWVGKTPFNPLHQQNSGCCRCRCFKSSGCKRRQIDRLEIFNLFSQRLKQWSSAGRMQAAAGTPLISLVAKWLDRCPFVTKTGFRYFRCCVWSGRSGQRLQNKPFHRNILTLILLFCQSPSGINGNDRNSLENFQRQCRRFHTMSRVIIAETPANESKCGPSANSKKTKNKQEIVEKFARKTLMKH